MEIGIGGDGDVTEGWRRGRGGGQAIDLGGPLDPVMENGVRIQIRDLEASCLDQLLPVINAIVIAVANRNPRVVSVGKSFDLVLRHRMIPDRQLGEAHIGRFALDATAQAQEGVSKQSE